MQNLPKVSDKTINRIQAGIDYTDLEKRRVVIENDRSRLIAEVSLLPHTYCHLRRCRRSCHCEGPAVHTLHRIDRVRAQIAIGLTGVAYKTLPRCLADMSKEQYDSTCRPFQSDIWPEKLSDWLRFWIKLHFRDGLGKIVRRTHGVRLGWETARQNWKSEYEAVMQVITRPAPVIEPDIPEWLVNFTFDPEPVETSILDRIDVLSGWRKRRFEALYRMRQTVAQV